MSVSSSLSSSRHRWREMKITPTGGQTGGPLRERTNSWVLPNVDINLSWNPDAFATTLKPHKKRWTLADLRSSVLQAAVGLCAVCARGARDRSLTICNEVRFISRLFTRAPSGRRLRERRALDLAPPEFSPVARTAEARVSSIHKMLYCVALGPSVASTCPITLSARTACFAHAAPSTAQRPKLATARSPLA